MGGLKKLFTERTSLDGVVLIGIGVVILYLGPLATNCCLERYNLRTLDIVQE